MIRNDILTTFEISVTGDTTGEKFLGNFECKIRLTHREMLLKDKIRRELLGESSVNASQLALDEAEVISELSVRITKAPGWWDNSNKGLDLYDYNLLTEIYNKVKDIENEYLNKINKNGEAARQELKKIADTQPTPTPNI